MASVTKKSAKRWRKTSDQPKSFGLLSGATPGPKPKTSRRVIPQRSTFRRDVGMLMKAMEVEGTVQSDFAWGDDQCHLTVYDCNMGECWMGEPHWPGQRALAFTDTESFQSGLVSPAMIMLQHHSGIEVVIHFRGDPWGLSPEPYQSSS